LNPINLMKTEDFLSIRLWTGIPPWILIGAVVILLPIFSYVTIENINHQKVHTERLLKEKGAALIRSFEAGTRTGMAGRWEGFQLQNLLMETAQQPDISHLIVTDTTGTIIASNDAEQIGKVHGKDLDLEAIAVSREIYWRIISTENGKKTFEVYRRFSPSKPLFGIRRNRRRTDMPFQSLLTQPEGGPDVQRYRPRDVPHLFQPERPPEELEKLHRVIFVGLDMEDIEEARHADAIHTVINGIILLFIGFAGFILLLFAQNYRMTRASLFRIKAFSDTLMENMPIGLIAMDPSLIITSFNHVADRLLNLSAVNAAGKKASEVIPAVFLDLVQSPDIQEQVVEKEIVCIVARHTSLPLEVSAAKLIDENGSFLGYVMLLKDLREVQSLKKALAISRRLASVGSLAAGVAHEIRNPLSSIKGLATYFKERYVHISEDYNVSTIMIQEVDRLNRVVSQLLEFARPVTVSRQMVFISDIISSTMKLIERQARERQIDIQMETAPELPPVFIDPDQINQVLLNLILNAIEAMSGGGEITIRAFKDKDRLAIQISDTGSGISETDLSRIYDPYFTTKPAGTGLGLAIVYNIIEAYDGDIKIESQMGKGTLVTIHLPIEDPL